MHKILLMVSLIWSGSIVAAELPADPTRPMTFTPKVNKVHKAAARHYALTYLVVGENRRLAVINDKQVVPGDRVDGAKVLSITTDGAVLLVNGKRRMVKISKQTGFKKVLSDRKRNGP